MKLRQIFLSAVALLAFTPCPAGQQDFLLDIPVEVAGHGLTLGRNSGMGFQSVPGFGFGVANGSHVRLGLDLSNEDLSPIVINDPLTGIAFTFTPANNSSLTLGLWDLLGNNGGQQFSFAVDESRINNVFGLVFPDIGFTFPVTKTGVVSQDVVDWNGTPNSTNLGFFNAFVQTDVQGTWGSSRLVDFTAGQQSGSGQTNLITGGWEQLNVSVITRPVTVIVPDQGGAAATDYTLHTSSGSLQNLAPSQGTIAGANGVAGGFKTTVSGQVGVRESFWLTRNCDSVASPQVTLHLGMGNGGAYLVDWSAVFPPLPVRTIVSNSFQIGSGRANHVLAVIHPDGFRSPLAPDPNQPGPNNLVTWDDNGNEILYPYHCYLAEIDTAQGAWNLWDETTNENLGQAAQIFTGFVPWHPQAPAGRINFQLIESRKNHVLRLVQDGGETWNITVDANYQAPGAALSYWNLTTVGTPPREKSMEIRYVPAGAVCSPALGFTIRDDTTQETQWFAAGSAPDLSQWYAPAEPMGLRVSVTRWTHDLFIVQPNGAQYPLTKGALQGVWSGTFASGASFTSFGWFDATALHSPGAAFTLWDATRNEFLTPDGGTTTDFINATDNTDTDGDLLPDWYEFQIGSNPLLASSGGSGIPDGWAVDHGLNPSAPAGANADNDGLTNLQEYLLGTQVLNADSDSDGLPDGWEVAHGMNPFNPNDAGEDWDYDGLTNLREYQLGTNLLNPDSDGDGIPDGWEVAHGMNPLNPLDAAEDWDWDGLTNLHEYALHTNPLAADTDADGIPDPWEVTHMLNPTDAADGGAASNIAGLTNLQVWQRDHVTTYSISIALGRASHAFTLHYSGAINGGETTVAPASVGLMPVGVVGEDGSYVLPANSHLQVGFTVNESLFSTWWVTDDTTGEIATVNTLNLIDAPWFVPVPGGAGALELSPIRAFAVPTARSGHALGVVLGNGLTCPVTQGTPLSGYVPLPNGESSPDPVPYGFFNASASVPDAAGSMQFVDLTTHEQATLNTTNLVDAAWSPANPQLLMRSARIFLGPALPGSPFTFHTSSGSLQGVTPAWDSVWISSNGTGYLCEGYFVSGTVSVLESFWLTRDYVPIQSAMMQMQWADVTVDWSTVFPPIARNLQSYAFQIGGIRAGHELEIRHADGYVQPLNSTLILSWTPDWGGNWGFHWVPSAGTLTTWDDEGRPINYYYQNFEALIDTLNPSWTLFDKTTNENLGQVTSLLEGWQVWHPEAPPGTLSIDMTVSRRSHSLVLRQEDGPDLPILPKPGFENSELTALQGTSEIRYYPASAPYDASKGCIIVDTATGDQSPYYPAYSLPVYSTSASVNLSQWYLAPVQVTVNMSVTRWTHELRLENENGEQFPVTKGSLQGTWSVSPGGVIAFDSSWRFDGWANSRPGLKKRFRDLKTNEVSQWDPMDLTSWTAADANLDTDGDDLWDWFEFLFGTAPTLWSTANDGYSDKWKLLHGLSPANPNRWNALQLALVDSDGDGYSDLEEIEAGTNPYSPFSTPNYPLLAIISPTIIEVQPGSTTTVALTAYGGPPPTSFEITSGTFLGSPAFGTVDYSNIANTTYDPMYWITTTEITVTTDFYAPVGSEADIEWTATAAPAGSAGDSRTRKKKPGIAKIRVVAPPQGPQDPQDRPSVSITAYSPGKRTPLPDGWGFPAGSALTTGSAVNGKISILRQNNDNDDLRTADAGQPEPRDNDDQTIGANDDDMVMIVVSRSRPNPDPGGPLTLTVPAGIRVFNEDGTVRTASAGEIDLDTIKDNILFLEGLNGFIGGDVVATYQPPAITPVTDKVTLLPVEVAPDLLPVNRGFGEGNINGHDVLDNTVDTIGHSLKAQRDTVDGRYKAGDFVTEDIHKGWFGVSPFAFDAAFFDGATVTIRKVIKRDSAGKVTEKGHVRFHATWGSVGEKQIVPYRYDNEILGEDDSGPFDLVGMGVFGSNATVPRTADLWMEGYYPGKITLEFRMQKGTLDFKHEQTFEVGCDWSKAKWQAVVRDHVFLLGKAAQPAASIDIQNYQVANGFVNNRKFVNSVFNYYGTLFLSGNSGNDTKYYWAGLAKTVGKPLYAALSDAQWGQISIVTGIPLPTANTCLQIQEHLMGGNIAVFEDLAWQHRAHTISGVRAMEFLEEHGAISNDTFQKWQAIGDILDVKSENDVQTANNALLRHEQSVVLKPYFDQLNAMTVAGVDVSYFLSILTKAPNGTPDFTTVVPGGNICDFNDRWGWITNPGQGMWPAWCQMGRNDRKNVVIFNFMQSAAGFSRLIGVPLVYFLTPSAVFPPP